MIFREVRAKLVDRSLILEKYYLVIFASYYFYMFLGASMFDTTWYVPIYRGTIVSIIIFFIVKLCTITEEDIGQWIIGLLFLTICGVCWISSGDKSILILGLFILSAKDIQFHKIVKISLVIGVIIMLAAFIGTKLGYIEDLVYHMRGTVRHSFGMSYTTDFAAHIFYLVLGYVYLKEGDLSWAEYISISALAFFVYHFCNARANTICMILILILLFFYQKRDFFRSKIDGCDWFYGIVKKIMMMIMPLCGITMICLTMFYNSSEGMWIRLNNLLTGRLALGKTGIIREGISLFGKVIQNVGLGRTMNSPESYTAIDSSYVLVLLERGIIFAVVISIVFVICSWRVIKYRHGSLLIILSIIAVQSMIEHHLLDISCNVFLLMLFSGESGYNSVKKRVKHSLKFNKMSISP